MRVIGTAGHVDHGKSTLVRALTGMDPDRLQEEKARGMTIDLGFAHFTLPELSSQAGSDDPADRVVSIIDVPGHRDFIDNMLAGVGGIDAVLFVVAADEGVMPQTREHLAIIDLLRIPAGIVALTKIDLTPDTDWLDLVQRDLAQAFSGTMLEQAPIIPVSARRGTGLDALQSALHTVLAHIPPRLDRGQPRLWVDRVFTVSGFGTVVTGTLLDGAFHVGQEVEVQPGGLRTRIRGIQAHGQPRDSAPPGSRSALNLAGVERSEIARGRLITLPGSVQPSALIDVAFEHLADVHRPLRHNAEVKFFCGAAETMARVRLLGAEQLAPGKAGWLQLVLAEPLPLSQGDRFIVRYPSPGETFGGGVVIDPHPAERWRRFRPDVITRFELLVSGEPVALIADVLNSALTPLNAAQIAARLNTQTAHIESLLTRIPDAIPLTNGFWLGAAAWTRLRDSLTRTLTGYHKAEPLRMGMAAEMLRSRLSLDLDAFRALMALAAERGALVLRSKDGQETVALPGHSIRFTAAQQSAVNRLLTAFADAPYTPPSFKEAEALVGAAVLRALLERGDVLALSADVLLTPVAYTAMRDAVRRTLADQSRIDVKTLRDQFGTSRKYALALLERLDLIGLTQRDGDDHVRGPGAWP